MAKGVVSGVFWGVVLSAGGLVLTNEVMGRIDMTVAPPLAEIEPTAPEVPQMPVAGEDGSDTPGFVSVPETVVPGAPPAPVSATESAMPEAGTEPAAKPAPAPTPGAEMTAPAAEAPVEAPAAEDPVLPAPESRAPEVTGAASPAPAPAPAPVVSREEPGPGEAVIVKVAPDEGASAAEEQAAAEPVKPMILATREGALTDRADSVTGVKTNRLPSIGGETPEAASVEETAAAAPSGRALFDNSVSFEPDATRPVMSIVLLDSAEGMSGPDLASLPFPVTFAIDANASGAAERAARYRAAGHEVVLVAELPAGASPADAAVTLEAAKDAVPGAVAVMDVPGANFQASRNTAAQVVASAALSGHGVITYARGLNAAEQVAAREGVPAAVVFRVFDGEGRNAAAMQRYLDQAAFRAAQTDGLIAVGHVKPDTLAALAGWYDGARAETVALAPVSAVLKANIPSLTSSAE